VKNKPGKVLNLNWQMSRIQAGALMMMAGRCGCPCWVEQLGAGLAAAAVNAVALIWKFAWIDFLTIRVEQALYRQS